MHKIREIWCLLAIIYPKFRRIIGVYALCKPSRSFYILKNVDFMCLVSLSQRFVRQWKTVAVSPASEFSLWNAFVHSDRRVGRSFVTCRYPIKMSVHYIPLQCRHLLSFFILSIYNLNASSVHLQIREGRPPFILAARILISLSVSSDRYSNMDRSVFC